MLIVLLSSCFLLFLYPLSFLDLCCIKTETLYAECINVHTSVWECLALWPVRSCKCKWVLHAIFTFVVWAIAQDKLVPHKQNIFGGDHGVEKNPTLPDCYQREQCSGQEQEYLSCSIQEAPCVFLPRLARVWIQVRFWGAGGQEGKRRAHSSHCISFVTLALCCCCLVIALVACFLFLQIYNCFFVFPCDWYVRGFSAFRNKIVLHWSCCSDGKQGSHEGGMNAWPKLEKPPSTWYALLGKFMLDTTSNLLADSL